MVNDGFYNYNSSYKLGVMTSQFFTEIPVDGVVEPTAEWVIGEPGHR